MTKRARPLHSGKGALSPSFFDATQAPAPKAQTTDPRQEIEWLRKLLKIERRRHGTVESVLTRTINLLERQLSDLRQLYMSAALKLETGPKQ